MRKHALALVCLLKLDALAPDLPLILVHRPAGWSPDGKQIPYGVSENGKFSIPRRALDGSQPEEVL